MEIQSSNRLLGLNPQVDRQGVSADPIQNNAIRLAPALDIYESEALIAGAGSGDSPVSAKQALALAATGQTGLAIQDSSKNIQKMFDRLVSVGSSISSITQTNADASLKLTVAQFSQGVAGGAGVLNKINSGSFKAIVLDAEVSHVSALQSYGSKITAFTVVDTAANLADGIATLAAASNLSKAVASEGKKTSIDVSMSDAVAYTSTLQKFVAKFNVQGTASSVISNASSLKALGGRARFHVQDTAANVSNVLVSLDTFKGKISQIEHTDQAGSYSLSVDGVKRFKNLFSKVVSGNFTLEVGDTAANVQKNSGWNTLRKFQDNLSSVTVLGDALSLSTKQIAKAEKLVAKLDTSNGIAVRGNAKSVTAAMDQLKAMGSQVNSITIQGKGYVGVSATTYTNEQTLLGKISSTNGGLAVYDASLSQTTSLLADSNVKKISVSADASDASGTTFQELLAEDRVQDISVSGASVELFTSLASEKKVKAVGIEDTSANLTDATNLAAMDAAIKQNKKLLGSIAMSDAQLMSVSIADYKSYANTVFKASHSFALQVDFTDEIPSSVQSNASQMRNWAQTTALSNGGFKVKLWDSSVGKYGPATTFKDGVNFIKMGSYATFLDSGDRDLNAVLYGGTSKWMQNPSSLVPTSSSDELKAGVYSMGNGSARTTIKYAFLSSAGQLTRAKDQAGFATMNTAQRASVNDAMNYLSSFINVKFELVTDVSSADIRFGTNDQGSVSGGYATGANSSVGTVNLMLNNAASVNASPEPGNYGWSTIIHEVGHTLGLKHPGPYNAGGGVPQGPFLSKQDDTTRLSVMSYKKPADAFNWSNNNGRYSGSSINAFTYEPLDILALQFIYGANTSGQSTTDTSKSLADFQTTSFDDNWLGMQTLIAGADMSLTIDASGVAADNIIDLRDGAFSSINILDSSYNSQINSSQKQTFFNLNNVGLAWGSQVRTVLGGDGTDVVYVDDNSATVNGGAGTDKLYLYGEAADWTSSSSGATTSYTNGSVTIAATGFESIAYYDKAKVSGLHDRVDLVA